MTICMTIGCHNNVELHTDFCVQCHQKQSCIFESNSAKSLAQQYPAYYKDVRHLDDLDVYAVHHIFNIQDPSGALQHASKKLLLSGVRTGGKTAFKDIKEARDTLTRWLQLNPEQA